MHIHLSKGTSADHLSRRLGANKLEFCCVVLEELQRAFDSAAIFRGVFLEAARRIASRQSRTHTQDDTAVRASQPLAEDGVMAPDEFGSNMYDALFGGIMDEISFSNFWNGFESMNYGVDPAIR